MMEAFMQTLTSIALNLLAAGAMLVGLFFMFTGALGVARLPDFYTRSHAASKCITLGICGLLLGLVLYMGAGLDQPQSASQAAILEEAALEVGEEAPVTAAVTKALLVIAFVFVSAPVGTHMLARAAHIAGVPLWPGTLSDELAEDRARQAGDAQ